MVYKTQIKVIEVSSIDEINELDNLDDEAKEAKGCPGFYARNIFQVIPTEMGYQVLYKYEYINVI